jgi:predicted DNA-binding ribbon-helix-helix protein
MIRTNFHLTEAQLSQLRELAEKTGLSVAELIRRAVDEFIKKQVKAR